MARSTVFGYKGKEIDVRRVGQELKVGALLTGSLIQQGDDLTIRAELVNALDGARLWAGKYNRKLQEIVSIQAEIAGQVSENLGLAPTGEQKQQPAKHKTENPQAFNLYLKGLHSANLRTVEGISRALPTCNRRST